MMNGGVFIKDFLPRLKKRVLAVNLQPLIVTDEGRLGPPSFEFPSVNE